jgi:hypothetical protein
VAAERGEVAMDLGLRQSGLFFALRLDEPNQIESPEENSFFAHAVTPVPGQQQTRRHQENFN